MAKKRTKAQRVAAAKAAWAKRRLRAAELPTPVASLPEPEDVKPWPMFTINDPPARTSPKIGYAVEEGNDIFICFGEDGSLRRERVSLELAKKVYKDLGKIVV